MRVPIQGVGPRWVDAPCPLCASEPCPCGDVHMVARQANPARTDDWCDRCFLPSVIVCTFSITCGHGWPITGISVAPMSYCVEHADWVSTAPPSA